jgi:hypothetical protein
MVLSVSDEELDIICEALQQREQQAEPTSIDDDRLKELRKLYQRLQTLRTAK